jgi:hypothetical protein
MQTHNMQKKYQDSMINIVYTNSNTEDVFNLFKKQHDRFSTLPLFVISDYAGDYVYSNADPYYKHWINALKHVQDDYFIYNQEDFLLYDKVQYDILVELKDFLVNNPKYSFVRLIKSGQNLTNIPVGNNVYSIGYNSYPLYSMQATIWNKQRFIELYNSAKQVKWFESEDYEKSCRSLGIVGVYYYNNEQARGGHYDSSVYPYIATAVVKGKWNIGEYPLELGNILSENNININNRGII